MAPFTQRPFARARMSAGQQRAGSTALVSTRTSPPAKGGFLQSLTPARSIR